MKMKKLVKAVALAVCLTMTAPVVAPSVGIETVEAATKVKLNCTKKSIYEGNRFKLKVTGTSKKVKWSSSNKKVATVSSKGSVKGISKGSCTITATVGGKKYTCKVTVKEKSRVYMINNRSVEYSRDEDSQRLFFGFLDQYENVVDGSGSVDVRIENDGVTVYEDTIDFSPLDFSTWTWNYGSVEKYVCCVRIPNSDITPGKNTQGKIYFSVNEKEASFDEYSLNIYDLPQKTATFNLPSIPVSTFESVTIKDGFTGKYKKAMCDINIDSITPIMESSYVELNITGNVTPTIDTITWTGSNYYHFTVKLIKDGVTVDSKMAMTPSIYLNDKFSCNVTFFDIDNTAEYTVQICSYN